MRLNNLDYIIQIKSRGSSCLATQLIETLIIDFSNMLYGGS
jgi:hypothetical protein